MAFGSKLLIKAGFVNEVPGSKYNGLFNGGIPAPNGDKKDGEWFDKLFDQLEEELGEDEAEKIFEDHAQHDWAEVHRETIEPTFFPIPLQRHTIIIESPKYSIEPLYFWCLNHMEQDIGYANVTKLSDVFAAAEHSSFYGAGAQRKSIAQDRVVQFLATTGKMIKELFQMVRELRWIDERLAIYHEAVKHSVSAERTLKGLWVDLVDGVVQGQRTGSNMLTMAQQLQFSTLPSLFFNIHAKTTKDIDKVIDTQAKGFNNQVKGVLRSKMQQYMQWKKSTYDELKVRRRFTLDYLAQHFNIIRMYMTWAKPYLRRIEALTENERHMDSASIIKSFETSFVEIEIMGQKAVPVGEATDNKKFAVLVLKFEFQTKPAMSFSQEGGYHRGPLHQGSTRIDWRCYAWTQKQIDAYIKMKKEEDLELMKVVDSSLASAMKALGKDLRKYLKDAGQKYPEKEKVKKRPEYHQDGLFEPFKHVGKALFEPFSALGKGLANSYHVFIPEKKKSGGKPKEGLAVFLARFFLFVHYKNFKKSHRLLAF